MRIQDDKFMDLALKEAQKAANMGEIPVGALIVAENGDILSRAHNLKEAINSPSAHAEVLAIEAAAKKLNSWRLNGCTIYVTLEPCLMCCGAILSSRVRRVVYATKDPKAGACESLYKTLSDPRLNHHCELQLGPLQKEAATLLKQFFRNLRIMQKNKKSLV